MPRSVYGGPQISRLEALGVLLHAFPSAVAAARPLSLSDLRPTAVYGGAVSMSHVGKLGVVSASSDSDSLPYRSLPSSLFLSPTRFNPLSLSHTHTLTYSLTLIRHPTRSPLSDRIANARRLVTRSLVGRAFPRLMSFATPRPRRLSPYLHCLGRDAYRPYSVSSHQQESASLASIQVEICVCGHPSLQNHPSPPHRQLDRKLLESCSGPALRRCYGRDPTFRPPRPAAVAEVLRWRALRGPLGGVGPAARRSGAGREWSTPPLPPLSCGYSTLPFKLTLIPSLSMYK
ncbi:hypothetical protein EDB85DRAFT_1885417 [Lactarius pseudohatsudake]|nr:hypothetical protein EDB85DRAFT_1885417 [Lactarius pseudohatsudake]